MANFAGTCTSDNKGLLLLLLLLLIGKVSVSLQLPLEVLVDIETIYVKYDI